MDSKEVNKAIRSVIRPMLKAHGFSKFSGRNSWRFHDERIDVINFQSFNSYNAEVIGCTTFSFSVNLGTFLTYVPEKYPLNRKDGVILPDEYQCHFRGMVHQTIEQSAGTRRDIWFIEPSGENLDVVINEAKQQIEIEGFSWFEQLADKDEVFRILSEDPLRHGFFFGFGNMNSPNRSYLRGYVAHVLGKSDIAADELTKVLSSGSYEDLFTTLEGALKRVPTHS